MEWFGQFETFGKLTNTIIITYKVTTYEPVHVRQDIWKVITIHFPTSTIAVGDSWLMLILVNSTDYIKYIYL